MTKRHFIALADAIRRHDSMHPTKPFTDSQLVALANFCAAQNPDFKADRWLDYAAGLVGPRGGKVAA